MFETIVALATPPFKSALAIIRVSGDDCFDIVSKCFSKDLTNITKRTSFVGYITNGEKHIDEVVLIAYKGPKSFTGEDLVEIICHGSMLIVNQIIKVLLSKGARLAEHGEYSMRAYLHNRIDLVQAEAINDVINATTEEAKALSLMSLEGDTSSLINPIKIKIADLIALIEVNIDYPEYEDIEVVTKDTLLPKLEEVSKDIDRILNNSRNGKLIKDGINIAIIGKPNVGKSSLLNLLLDEEKAIVTDIPGTTRDIVEGSITLNGFLINFIDTAGIRETDDIVEKIGVERSKNAILFADLVILVLNNNEEISNYEKELIKEIDKDKLIVFVNKSDLDTNLVLDINHIKGNTLSIDGIDELKKEIISKLKLNDINKDLTYMSNIRQIDLLKKAKEDIESAINNLSKGMPVDIVEIDITNAWNNLGSIIGEVYQDELINTLFSNFCLGK